MTNVILLRPFCCHPRHVPFVTVDAAQHLPHVATSHTSTPEAARAACMWMAAQEPDADRRAFWTRYSTRRQYGQEMHQ